MCLSKTALASAIEYGLFFFNLKFCFVKNLGWNLWLNENVNYLAAALANKMTMRIGVAIIMHLVITRIDGGYITVKGKQGKIAINCTKTEIGIVSMQAVIDHIRRGMSFDTFHRLENLFSLVGVSHY